MKTPSTPFILVNLHSPDAAQLAGSHNHVYFYSAVHPKQLLGHLWDEDAYEGAWMENFRVLALLGGKMHTFETPGVVPQDPSELAASVLRALLAGQSPEMIQEALDNSTEKTYTMIF
jgi:hypothetical protein